MAKNIKRTKLPAKRYRIQPSTPKKQQEKKIHIQDDGEESGMDYEGSVGGEHIEPDEPWPRRK